MNSQDVDAAGRDARNGLGNSSAAVVGRRPPRSEQSSTAGTAQAWAGTGEMRVTHDQRDAALLARRACWQPGVITGIAGGFVITSLLAACLGMVLFYLRGPIPVAEPSDERLKSSRFTQKSSQPANGAVREAGEPDPGGRASWKQDPNVPSPPGTPDPQGASATNRAPVSQAPASPKPSKPTTGKKTQWQRGPVPSAQDKAAQNSALQRIKQSVAYVKGKESSGTGFVVRHGIVATNSHVIGNEYIENLRVQFLSAERPDSKELKVKLLYEDRNRDIALLALDTPEESPPPLVLAEAQELPKEHPIVVIGNPIKEPIVQRPNSTEIENIQEANRASEGTVHSLIVVRKQTWYHLKADTAPGNSGGPVLDARTGQVLGILTLGSRDPLPDGDQFEDVLRQARLRTRRGEIAVRPQRRDSYCIPCQFLREALRKMEDPDMPKKSPKEVAACHLAEMVVWNVDLLHSRCQGLAKKQLEYLRTGRRVLVAELNRGVVEKNDTILKSLGPSIRAVRSNLALSPAVRQGVHNLLDNYEQLRKQTERTSAANELKYRELLYKLSQNHSSCLKQLSKALVVPETD